ncbi:MAG: citramalate synthase [Polyangiaceae bacterium]|jgi:2-isopropylmalate synthase|nr:citramalate synthase [Polyangiaceae bacterium]
MATNHAELHLCGQDDNVVVVDTTLRDGTQREGISLSCQDKMRIAQRLDSLGVAIIEGGWPGSNPKDAEFFERARAARWTRAAITAFSSTRRAGIAPQDDPVLQALLEAGTKVCTIFGKSWTRHVDRVLRTSRDENLRMIESTVAYLCDQGRRVIYDAEHFFDGYGDDPDYALATLRAAQRGGAEVIVLCETNGGALPWQVENAVRKARESLGCPLGIHAHDDSGCGVANTLAAVRAGARHVQGTINGYGERCGNANLCSVIPDLELKMGLRCLPAGHLSQLFDVAHYVAEMANLMPNDHAPFVGRSAFAHKAGVHVAAIRRDPDSYQHVKPERVGNQTRVVVSELSGRANVLSKAQELGLSIPQDSAVRVLEEIKRDEALGFSFEAAEASVALMLRRSASNYDPLFRVLDYKVLVGHKHHGAYAEATVKLLVRGRVMHTASEGNGPVGAVDAALRKALVPLFPDVERIQLTDYKVRILDGRDGTSAVTRVLIDSSDGRRSWSTVGASANIIEASCRALIDGIEYGLLAMLEAGELEAKLEEEKEAS